MGVQESQKKQIREESCLLKIPVLGYILRKIRENRQAIEKALKTGKEVKGKTKKRYFLGGLMRVISERKFRILKLKKKKTIKRK